MRVTIIGTGNMARGIGTRVLAGGHELSLLDRDEEEARELAAELRGSSSAGAATASGRARSGDRAAGHMLCEPGRRRDVKGRNSGTILGRCTATLWCWGVAC
jgi:3-hydroxyacyl-CoA dehydrogenase